MKKLSSKEMLKQLKLKTEEFTRVVKSIEPVQKFVDRQLGRI